MIQAYHTAGLPGLILLFLLLPVCTAADALSSHTSSTVATSAARTQALQNAQSAELARNRGNYRQAIAKISEALELADQAGDIALQAALHAQLGSAWLYLGETQKAEQTLQAGIRLASAQHETAVEAALRNDLGQLRAAQGRVEAALSEYRRAATLAKQGDHQSLLAKVALGATESLLNSGQVEQASGWLRTSATAIAGLDVSRTRINLQIKQARLEWQLARLEPGQQLSLTGEPARDLRAAAVEAEQLQLLRAASYAWGYLGRMREQQGDYAEALRLTDKALFLAQQVRAPEANYLWTWQQGRLLRTQGESTAAIRAYRRAVVGLQAMRKEFVGGNQRLARGFREDAGTVFLQLADLLLQQSDQTTDSRQRQQLLAEARETVELLKALELQNYFNDDCVAAVHAKIRHLDDTVVPGTAVLYPILLDDRIELLLRLSDGIIRAVVPVGKRQLTNEVHSFRALLEKRTTRQYLRPAQKIYQWLIAPLESALSDALVDTLIVVPDSSLRTIPFAALHDDADFLIQRYAIAITPSLRLTDPRPIERRNMRVLLNGLSAPVQGYPALIRVNSELDAIQQMYGGRRLQNETFREAEVREELADHEYSIVHFATHGQFTGKVEDSYLLTWDGRIGMDDLEQSVGASWFRDDRPVELLTLSACDSAAGDDNAALGLASIAIRAGARSALASLWAVNDQASSELVAGFYRQLLEPGVSKAGALQQAQLSLLDDLRYRHPGYWAPFVLIGNWL